MVWILNNTEESLVVVSGSIVVMWLYAWFSRLCLSETYTEVLTGDMKGYMALGWK